MPNATKIDRRDQGYKYVTGCNAGENVNDYWNVNGIENCQIRGQVLQRPRCWMQKTTGWIYLVRGETDKKANDIQTRLSLWPEIWKDMLEASKRREKQKRAIEKPKRDTARKLRGIYFIDPADEEFKDIMKNVRRKLEVPMPAAMLCRTGHEEYRETCSVLDNCRTKYACIVEAHDSLRKRMEGTLHKGHEDCRERN